MIDKHHDAGAFERAAALAWTQAQVQLHHLGIDRERGAVNTSASPGTWSTPRRCCARHRRPLQTAAAGSRVCGALGISGDLPIILVRISDIDQLDVAREALQAVEYWRMKRLAVDLVILNERAPSYVQDLQIALETLVQGQPVPAPDRRGAAAGAHLHAARRPDLAGGAGPAGVRRACRAGGRARQPRRSARARA